MKKLKSLLLTAVTIISVGALVGCSSDELSDSKVETRTVSSLNGDVEIPSDPKRIVDISGSSEELLILGYKPVATANVDSYETDKVPSYIADKLGDVAVVGHSMLDTADIEGILNSNPDLIIMSKRQEKIYDQLKDIAPVVMMKDYENNWREKLIDVSKLFEKEEIANNWLSEYDEKAKTIGKEIMEKNGDRTYLTALSYSGQFMIFSNAGIGTIVNEDMELSKPTNLPKQDGISLPVVTLEGLTEIDTDHIIIISTEADKQDLEKNSVWSELRAVKEGNVTMLNASPFFSQGYNPLGRELMLNSLKDEIIK